MSNGVGHSMFKGFWEEGMQQVYDICHGKIYRLLLGMLQAVAARVVPSVCHELPLS